MELPYEHTSYVWPLLVSVVFLAVMGFYAIRHHTVPGAVPFTILAGLIILWELSNALGLTATTDETRIFWFKFSATLLLPAINAALCFVLEYSGLGKWLTRRTLILLTIPVLVLALLILTNEFHHLVWTRIWFDEYVQVENGPANWWAIGYGYLLSLLHMTVLAWLFVRSPRHRWIAGGLFIAPVIIRGAYILNILNWNPVAPLNLFVAAVNFAILPYAVAIFRFQMFDVVPVARNTVFDKMLGGMIVLDAKNRIVDLNKTVETLFGIVRSKAVGGQAAEVFSAYPELLSLVQGSNGTQWEFSFGNTNARWFQVSLSPIIDDRRRFQLGRLIWFHDITEERLARAQMLDQQMTLAMLKERELLARELHDGIGQMLAAAQLQAKLAIDLLTKGEKAAAEYSLRRIAEVTQEAKESIRTYLLGVKAGSTGEQGLLPALREYLDQYSRSYKIRTELLASPEFETKRIDAAIAVQLQPIIHEALTNVMRHGGAGAARVSFASCNGRIQVTIEDDGQGFDPAEKISGSRGFGLRSMRGRAEAVGGRFEVNSTPGKGTRIVVQVPWRREEI